MNLVYKSIKYVSGAKVFLPFEGTASFHLKKGEEFKKGDIIFSINRRKILESHNLLEELDLKNGDISKYVCRIEGEYVPSGEVIAERSSSGGFSINKIECKKDGIIDLSRIASGYIDILAELDSEDFKAEFSGRVIDIDTGKGIVVQSDVCEVSLSYLNSSMRKSYNYTSDFISGNFKVIGEKDTLLSKKLLDKSYKDDIVYAGRFIYSDLAEELFERGCKFILVGSMDYADISRFNLPVGLINGFGNIPFDTNLFFAFKELEGFEATIDINLRSLHFVVGLNSNLAKLFQPSYYKDIQEGDIVRSCDIETFGFIGKVLKLGEQKAKVIMQDDIVRDIALEELEYYSEDFSAMALSFK